MIWIRGRWSFSEEDGTEVGRRGGKKTAGSPDILFAIAVGCGVGGRDPILDY